jgi:muramoyltetrapeptide carboxypeptidase
MRGRILVLEEIGEPPYRLDRMLTQMRLAGMLDGIEGVLVGSLRGCGSPRRAASALEAVSSFFLTRGIPVVAGLPIGHTPGKVSIPLGFRARIDTTRSEVVFAP